MIMSIQIALVRGHAIRHSDWPPFHYAKLTKGSDCTRKLYRCYPDGHVEILNVEVQTLREEDGWLIQDLPHDEPVPAA